MIPSHCLKIACCGIFLCSSGLWSAAPMVRRFSAISTSSSLRTMPIQSSPSLITTLRGPPVEGQSAGVAPGWASWKAPGVSFVSILWGCSCGHRLQRAMVGCAVTSPARTACLLGWVAREARKTLGAAAGSMTSSSSVASRSTKSASFITPSAVGLKSCLVC